MRMLRLLSATVCTLAACAVLAVPLIVRAQQSGGCPGGASPIGQNANGSSICPASGSASSARGSSTVLENPLGDVQDIPTLLGRVMRAGFGIVGSLALLMFVYGGFLWLTSGGRTEMIEKGRQTMVWSALGLAVIFSSYAIVNFVVSAITRVK